MTGDSVQSRRKETVPSAGQNPKPSSSVTVGHVMSVMRSYLGVHMGAASHYHDVRKAAV